MQLITCTLLGIVVFLALLFSGIYIVCLIGRLALLGQEDNVVAAFLTGLLMICGGIILAVIGYHLGAWLCKLLGF